MTFKRRYIIILTFNTIISLLFTASIPYVSFRYMKPREYKDTGLITLENFHKELYARLTNDQELLNEVPRGPHILMVLTNDRGVVYNKGNKDLKNLDINTALYGLRDIYDSQARYRTETFLYGEDYGLFVFKIDRKSLIGAIRLYLLPITLFIIIVFVILPSSINFALLYNLKKSFSRLERAADDVSRGNFDINLERKKKDELYSFYNSFNRMGKILKENRDQKSRLLMSISHDLKTPLTSMKGYIEAFKDGIIPEEKRDDYLNVISSKSAILEERINGLVDFAKIETNEWKQTFTTVNMLTFLEDIALAFNEDCIIYNREFVYEIGIPENITISGDPKLLNRAIENLLENAKRYSHEGAMIGLSASMKDDNIEIVINDNGKGISQEDLKYIFEPFYRADKSRNAKGMGMGLYSVKSIVESHGGNIVCESEQGVGSRFTITLT